ncbi:hypothetical protein ACS0TY_012401 [Phlomoides rotata]
MKEIAQNQVMITKTHRGGAAASSSRRTKINTTGQITRINEAEEEVKLAALAINFNIRLRSADMAFPMQERALRHARALLDSAPLRRPSPSLLARSLKKEFDSVYGPAWHCVVGTSFGSFVTHSPGGFLYFSVDSLSFLLFKTEVHVIAGKTP